MRKILLGTFISLVAVATIVSCNSTKETLDLPLLQDYYPMQVGRVFTYRLDSTALTNFSTQLTKKYYLAKDSVESQFTDNLGRQSFRIYRYLRDTLSLQPWVYTATYYATINNDNQSAEFVDNNIRFLKMRLPITNGSQWQGNTYIDTKSANSDLKYFDGWVYELQNVGGSYNVRKGNFTNTITVFQHDETLPNVPFTTSLSFQERDYSIEVYAKGVGLIYKDFLHYTWQTSPSPGYQSNSYGVRLSLVDYK